MATRHSSGSARDRRRSGGNLPRTHPSRHGPPRSSGDRRQAPAPSTRKQHRTPGIPEGRTSGTSVNGRQRNKSGGKQQAPTVRHAQSDEELHSASWEEFDDIFNKLGLAADVCAVAVGYLMGPACDTDGRDACAMALDNYVYDVVREQATRIKRIYTGRLARSPIEGPSPGFQQRQSRRRLNANPRD